MRNCLGFKVSASGSPLEKQGIKMGFYRITDQWAQLFPIYQQMGVPNYLYMGTDGVHAHERRGRPPSRAHAHQYMIKLISCDHVSVPTPFCGC